MPTSSGSWIIIESSTKEMSQISLQIPTAIRTTGQQHRRPDMPSLGRLEIKLLGRCHGRQEPTQLGAEDLWTMGKEWPPCKSNTTIKSSNFWTISNQPMLQTRLPNHLIRNKLLHSKNSPSLKKLEPRSSQHRFLNFTLHRNLNKKKLCHNRTQRAQLLHQTPKICSKR